MKGKQALQHLGFRSVDVNCEHPDDLRRVGVPDHFLNSPIIELELCTISIDETDEISRSPYNNRALQRLTMHYALCTVRSV